MSSRALILATVLLVIGWLGPALAQENLDAGKTPSQIFAGTCNACHKSPRGLLKTVSPSALPSFLRQHYTTSPNMAGVLSSYLVSNGATDTRLPPAAKGAKEGAKQEAKQEPVRPSGPPDQLDRWGRRIHPAPAPQEAAAPPAEPKPEEAAAPAAPATPAAAQPAAPVQAAVDSKGHDNAKQKLSKRSRPGEALPKEEPKPGETAAREEAKPEAAKPEVAKPAEEGRSQSAKVEQPSETSVARPDPVPAVTPAPASTATAPSASAPPAVASAPPPAQTLIAAPVQEMAVPLPASAVPPPPAVTASSAPPQPPVPPAGPPAPPISQ